MQFVLDLEENSQKPVYKQVCEALRRAIEEGRLKAGEKLPSTRELAAAVNISRFTAIHSYELLTAQGLINTVVGSGTFVSNNTGLLKAAHQTDVDQRQAPDASLSTFGLRMLNADTFEPADAELYQELNYGAPSIEQIPLRQWREVLNKCARFKDKTLFQYVSDPMGYLHLREAICTYLTRARSVKCDSGRLALFSGAQSAVDLVCRVLLNAGDSVAVENPGFPGARRIFNAHGAKIVTIAVDGDGLIVDDLYKHKAIKLVYVTPSHQDPMGVVMSVARRKELLKWAQENNAFILEDDYDSEYHYGEKPVPALQGLDGGDCVIYLSSFWKVLFPVVRVAFLALPRRLLVPMHRAKSYIERDFPLLEQIALTEFLNEGILERQIKRSKSLYARRRAALVLALAKNVKDLATMHGATAGMHMILHFDKSLPAEKIIQYAREAEVPMASTSKHYIGDYNSHEFMVAFAHHTEQELSARIENFATLLKKGRKNESNSGVTA